MKFQDLFPQDSTKPPVLENPRTTTLFEELQDRLAALEARNANQRWLQSEAQALISEISEVRWLLVEQDVLGIPVPVLVVVFWDHHWDVVIGGSEELLVGSWTHWWEEQQKVFWRPAIGCLPKRETPLLRAL
jgi:hypothetical protein